MKKMIYDELLHTNRPMMRSEELRTLEEDAQKTRAAQADTDALCVEYEYRLTLLELGV